MAYCASFSSCIGALNPFLLIKDGFRAAVYNIVLITPQYIYVSKLVLLCVRSCASHPYDLHTAWPRFPYSREHAFFLLPNWKRQEKVKSHVSVSTFSHRLYLFHAWVPTNLSVILPTWRDVLPRILEGSVVIYGEMHL